jgi:hypothetical protein
VTAGGSPFERQALLTLFEQEDGKSSGKIGEERNQPRIDHHAPRDRVMGMLRDLAATIRFTTMGIYNNVNDYASRKI